MAAVGLPVSGVGPIAPSGHSAGPGRAVRVTLEGPKNYSDWRDAITAVATGSKNPLLALVFNGDGAAFKEQLAVALAELTAEPKASSRARPCRPRVVIRRRWRTARLD